MVASAHDIGFAAQEAPGSRRIVALVLPEFLNEVASRAAPDRQNGPFGVVLIGPGEEGFESHEPLRATARLDSVNPAARRLGIRSGQTIAEASALYAGLDVRRLAPQTVEHALAAVAEVALGFGATVALALPDTVWVDVTGSAHLFGGEEAIGEELGSRVRALGHVVRLAAAEGPELARAFARWAPPDAKGKSIHVVPKEETAEAVRALPVVALPIGQERQSWLVRLGVLTLGDLTALPAAALGSRLEGDAVRALELARGHDSTPLVPYQPPDRVIETVSFEHALDGVEPLRFALRGLTARLSARLAGRGMAADSLLLTIVHDRVVSRFRGTEPETRLKFALSEPLHKEEDVLRIVMSRLERMRLSAPSVALRLEAPVLVPAVARQLELGQSFGAAFDVDRELPLLLAELMADVGETRVGVLRTVDAHRLEARSELRPALAKTTPAGGRKKKPRREAHHRTAPPVAVHVSGAPLEVVEGVRPPPDAAEARSPLTRLLPEPVELESTLRTGATLAVDRRLFTIQALRFEQRLHAVEWWTGAPVMRDYVRLWLKSSEGVVEALAYVDRATGKRYLQAIAD